MNRVLGIVFSNMHEHMVNELTALRCMGSIPIGGRYRLIDFVLSGFANSGVHNVGVITKSNYQSLMGHLGSGRDWDLARKNGGLVILPPFGHAQTGVYRSRIEALAGILGYIRSTNAESIIMADSDLVASLDFRDFMEAHRKSGAEYTLMYSWMQTPESRYRDRVILEPDRDGVVRGLLINPDTTGVQAAWLNILAVKRRHLEKIIEECISRSRYSFESDVLMPAIERGTVNGYEFQGYLARVDSMRSYYEASLALLDPAVRASVFPKDSPIYTRIGDEAPVRYGLSCSVSNSLIADGCLIEGEVENSILFRGVTVDKGAKVQNCIMMHHTQAGENSSLEYVICDKNVRIRESRILMGFETYPVYIAKGSVV